jgi:hypothetical protein
MEAQADTTLHFLTHDPSAQHVESQTEGNDANRAGRPMVTLTNYKVLPNIVSAINYCVIYY